MSPFSFGTPAEKNEVVPFTFGKPPGVDNSLAVVDKQVLTVDDILNAEGSVLGNMQKAVFGKKDGSKFLVGMSCHQTTR